MDAWFSSKRSLAESDDYGQDLDDVEVKENKIYCMYCMAKQECVCCNFCVAADNEACYSVKTKANQLSLQQELRLVSVCLSRALCGSVL